jgi:hypothetical protein
MNAETVSSHLLNAVRKTVKETGTGTSKSQQNKEPDDQQEPIRVQPKKIEGQEV